MKNLLIDTNIYTHALAGDLETIDILRHAQKSPFVALASVNCFPVLKALLGKRRIERSLKNFWTLPV